MSDLKLTEIYEWLSSNAKSKNVEVELCSHAQESLRVSYQNNKLDLYQNDSSNQLGLRLVNGEQEGVAYLESFAKEDLIQAFTEAFENSKFIKKPYASQVLSPRDDEEVIGAPSCPDLFHKSLGLTSIHEKMKMAEQLEASTLSNDTRIASAPRCLYYEASKEFAVWNTKGLHKNYQETYCIIHSSALTKENDQAPTSGGHSQLTRDFKALDPEAVSKTASQRAIARLNTKSLKSGGYPVLFSKRAAQSLFQFCLPLFSSLNVIQSSSLLAGKLQARVFSKLLNIIDDPLAELGAGTRPFDGEGYTSSATSLVESGILTNYLTHFGLASQMGLTNSGHCARGAQMEQGVAASNFVIQPGAAELRELKQGYPSLVYVQDLKSSTGFNNISGQFSIEAVGDLLENGEHCYPLKNFVLSGQILEVFNKIVGIADEIEFSSSKVTSPEILIENIMIAAG